MAELTMLTVGSSGSCCAPDEQATCCDPADKQACCGAADAGRGCGCPAGGSIVSAADKERSGATGRAADRSTAGVKP